MTDNSNIVFRWEIDDAALTAGKAKSSAFNEGGFKWHASIHPSFDDPFHLDVNLHCDYEGHGEWHCKAESEITIGDENMDGSFSMTKDVTFDYGNGVFKAYSIPLRHGMTNKILLKFRINIISSSKFPLNLHLLNLFPIGMDNATLVVGDKKVRVCKEYLAVHSPVLAVMFFGDFAEKGKDEIEIKDVIYEEFLDLLYLIYLGMMEVTDFAVPHILKLADRFQMERVLIKAEKHLIQSERFDTVEKLMFSDQYRLASLKGHCLDKLSNAASLIEKIKSSPEYANLSVDMKDAIESVNEV